MSFVSILSQKSDKIVIFPRNKPFGTLFVIDKSEYNYLKERRITMNFNNFTIKAQEAVQTDVI